MPGEIYDQSLFDAFCDELIREGFSPAEGSDQRRWVGPTPPELTKLTNATEMVVRIPDGWPVRSARVTVPGLIADHVTAEGYICLWADDDPAQASATTYRALKHRLLEWIESATTGFERADQALDAFAFFEARDAPHGEIDLPQLLGAPDNGATRVVHGGLKRQWTFARTADEHHPLEGPIYFRSKVAPLPRSLEQFRASLTRAQRQNLDHGLFRRSDAREATLSGGYDFAVLVWPRYQGEWDALFLTFAGAGPTLSTQAHRLFPSDTRSRLKRAGPRAGHLAEKRVLVVGVGSVGGQVAVSLAAAGVGHLTISDGARLQSVNLVRHVVDSYGVGFPKTAGVADRIEQLAPWSEVVSVDALPESPADVATLIRGFDLVVDCTGIYSTSIALAHACALEAIGLVSVALYHAGGLARVRRQLPGDLPILERIESNGYPKIPDAEADDFGFLELGCTSPVHNAPPAAVTRSAADAALTALDVLFGDLRYSADVVTVFEPVENHPPFDSVGTFPLPLETLQ